MRFSTSILATFTGLLALTTAAPSAAPARRDSANCPGHAVSEDEQKALWDGFVQTFFVEKDVAKAYALYVADDVIEHNPDILDGAAAAVAALKDLIPQASFDILHNLFDCPTGAIHAKVSLAGGAPFAESDFFRYDGSCIVEHWDVIQTVPDNAVNPHPLF